ncbi:HD family phosphohydrolase [Capnocytophaga cynodegmi]|uniref:7TM receptor with intracellular HD hydrolase n=1 Tax=Capnocytophaga cynodegmi TaxID=28189 RepID=A0A0B7H4V5_9FLAO|nr:HDIG domain-containing metalloprotein [Capnocytophaga cynodegmi]CEN32643.1 7TM receptor with intracellular HD hydrolase [Capnocytophaga cynodegmi]
MKKFRYTLYLRESMIFKLIAFLVALILIVQVFPKKAKFKYEFQKGKLWQHETLYAPFDFPLKKTAEQIETEKEEIKENSIVYYQKDPSVYQSVISNFNNKKNTHFNGVSEQKKQELLAKGEEFLKKIYQEGVILSVENTGEGEINLIRNGNEFYEVSLNNILKLNELNSEIAKYFSDAPYNKYKKNYYDLFFEILQPDITIEQNFTKKTLEESLKEIVYTRGWVKKGQLIIARGEMVEGERFNTLLSLQSEYEEETWNHKNYVWSLTGYYVLVSIVLLVIGLYLKIYEKEIYKNNVKIAVILINMLTIIAFVGIITQAFPQYIYIVPVGMMALILKSFFDLRTVIFVFIATILIIGFIVPNSFQFVFIQVVGVLAIIIAPRDLHYRLNSFVSAALITGAYFVIYTAFHAITEGTISGLNISLFTLFFLNGVGMLFSQPFTYIYEKAFGLVSDVSLLELSDTNSKLLRELSEKAPGTFQHSMQVANLAETAASEIGANALLVRVGALYHDIGKMLNPVYFIENQKTTTNPHDSLTPTQSAKIIIGHVTDGIELARKNKLPQRIIDFIRTHHGTSLAYYFYRKEFEQNSDCQEFDFRYPGPKPFSKETAILMMADSVEAATKSLKNPTYEMLDEFVEKIIKKQLDDNQFMNADITLKEIEKIKKVFKDKLTNIYHIRIAYPE